MSDANRGSNPSRRHRHNPLQGNSSRPLTLLGSLDLFLLWSVALLILGCHLAARVSKAASAAIVIGLWLLLVAGLVGLAGLRMTAGGAAG